MIFNNFLEAKQFYLVFLQYMKATKRTVLKKSVIKCIFAWEFEEFCKKIQPLLRKAVLLKTKAHWKN